MQDNLLTPENYKSPVKPFKKDITCPIFLQIFQKAYSYIQIVRVETNEDISWINLVPKNKVEIFTKYQDSFAIASPGSDEILKTWGPACDITLQLAANVLTQRRYYKTLINVMGEVWDLMEFFYGLFKIIVSYIVNESYEKSLVNNLFSFDIKRKLIILKNKEAKNNMNDLDDKKYEQNFNKNQSMINNITNNEDFSNIGIEKNYFSESVNERTYSKLRISGENKIKKDEILKNINKSCFCLRNKKRNLYKILFEEGMKLITEKLDFFIIFNNSYMVEKIKKDLSIDSSIHISEENKKYIPILEKNDKNTRNKII